MDNTEPRISLLAEDALLLHFSDQPERSLQWRLHALAELLRCGEQGLPGLEDVVPGPGSLMLRIADGSDWSLTSLTGTLEQLWKSTLDGTMAQGREVEIPVHYGGSAGPDLDEVARSCGLTTAEVIERHSKPLYEVLCLGFQPGFPYLDGLDEKLFIPRRATPRSRIRAGSVAIGGERTGIYPGDSPGGWHIIGHSTLELFNPRANPPCRLRAGDRVRFLVEG